jgi:hypothetical protein
MSRAARYAHLSPKHKQSVVDRVAVTISDRRSQEVAEVTTPNMHQPSKGKKKPKGNDGNKTA